MNENSIKFAILRKFEWDLSYTLTDVWDNYQKCLRENFGKFRGNTEKF